MKYIYDLVLNFNDSCKNLDFYEWKKSDNILTIHKMPLVRINRVQMNDIITSKIKIAREFLSRIRNKTLLEDGSTLKNSVLVTDLNKVLALEFDDDGVIIRSSSLLLDEEEAVIDESLDYAEEKFDYEVLTSYTKQEFLTREEKKIRSNLLSEIDYLYKNKNYDEIRYLYEELYDEQINVHEKYKFLMKDIENNYNSKYNKLYDIIRLT